jgi:hypothetical protein
MRKLHGKYGVLAVLVLALLLGLLLTAGPAMATTTTLNTTQGMFLGELYPGESYVNDAGTLVFWDWVAYSVTVRATGPDRWRFLGTYGVARLDGLIPLKGDNYHWGPIVFVSRDPLGIVYDPDKSLIENLAPYGLLWTGTWDGYTLNKRNHKVIVELVGWPGTVNGPYTAHVEIKNGGFDQANYHSDNYVGVPWNSLVYLTGP